MTKDEFMARLREALSGLPESEISRTLDFYDEMIDDRIEDGMTEAAAVEAAGPIETIVAQAVTAAPLGKLVRERVKPKGALPVWGIVLLVAGSPVWLPLLAAAVTIVLAVYAVLWSLALAVWCVCLGLGAGVLGSIGCVVLWLIRSSPLAALAALGSAFVCAGGAILLFFGAKLATRGIIWLSRRVTHFIKSRFVKRSEEK